MHRSHLHIINRFSNSFKEAQQSSLHRMEHSRLWIIIQASHFSRKVLQKRTCNNLLIILEQVLKLISKKCLRALKTMEIKRVRALLGQLGTQTSLGVLNFNPWTISLNLRNLMQQVHNWIRAYYCLLIRPHKSRLSTRQAAQKACLTFLARAQTETYRVLLRSCNSIPFRTNL